MQETEAVRARVLVTPRSLAELRDVLVLAVRNPRRNETATPRIPGAVDVDLPGELAAPGRRHARQPAAARNCRAADACATLGLAAGAAGGGLRP